MHCPNCGREIENQSVFCGFCGTRINRYHNESAFPDNNDIMEPKKKSRWPLILLVIILALVALASSYLFLLRPMIEKDSIAWQEQYDLGVRYLDTDEYEKAIIAFETALEIDPKSVESYIGLADAYTAQGQLDKALEIIETAQNVIDDFRLDSKKQELTDNLTSLSNQNSDVKYTPEDIATPSETIVPSELVNPTSVHRLVQVTHYTSQGENRSEYYKYDSNGNLVSEIREILGDVPDEEISYYYNDNGQIMRIEYNEYAVTTFIYDEAGRLIQENGPDYVTDYTYESDRIASATTSASEITQVIHYFYNDNGELVETQSDNHQWAEEMESVGAEWIPRYESTSYYRYFDNNMGIREVESQGKDSVGNSSHSYHSTSIWIMDSAGTEIAVAAQWDDNIDVERDEKGYVEKLTYYNEDGTVYSYDVLIYEDYSLAPGQQSDYQETYTQLESNKDLVGTYVGTYFANQGETGLTLTIYTESSQLKALFEFYDLFGNAENGSFIMNVSIDNGTIVFFADEWIDQPSTYEFVNLEGEITDDGLSGNVYKMDGTCVGDFNLKRVSYVYDFAGLLTAQEIAELNKAADEISSQFNCMTYIGTIDDMNDLGYSNIEKCSEYFYDEYIGEQTGILLLLSMEGRDYDLDAYGSYAQYAFTDYGKTTISDAFLDCFRSNQWCDGFEAYLNQCEILLEYAASGSPVDIY